MPCLVIALLPLSEQHMIEPVKQTGRGLATGPVHEV